MSKHLLRLVGLWQTGMDLTLGTSLDKLDLRQQARRCNLCLMLIRGDHIGATLRESLPRRHNLVLDPPAWVTVDHGVCSEAEPTVLSLSRMTAFL